MNGQTKYDYPPQPSQATGDSLNTPCTRSLRVWLLSQSDELRRKVMWSAPKNNCSVFTKYFPDLLGELGVFLYFCKHNFTPCHLHL